MDLLGNKWRLVALGFLCWALLATVTAAYYYSQYDTIFTRYSELRRPIAVNVLLDYGNGTRIWFNQTSVSSGATAYDALAKVASVKVKWYGDSVFVTAINNVEMSGSYYWAGFVWGFGQWNAFTVAFNKYLLSPGESILFYYTRNVPPVYPVASHHTDSVGS